MNTCNKCHIDKPDSEFCADSSRACGLQSCCKPCHNAMRAVRLSSHSEHCKVYMAMRRAADLARAVKTCAMCHTEKPTTEFAELKLPHGGFHSSCKACNKANAGAWYAAWRAANPLPNKDRFNPNNAAKTCTGCHTEKAITEFRVRPDRPCGFASRCVMCSAAQSAAWKTANPDHVEKKIAKWRAENHSTPEPSSIRKICGSCLIDKCGSLFNADRTKKDGLSTWCNSCNKTKLAVWRVENLERERASGKAWYAANKERAQARNLAWYEVNTERAKAAQAKWKKTHPERCRASGAARKAAKLRARPAWRDDSKIAEFYQLAQRLSEQTGVEHVVDHIVPLLGKTVCGLHVEANLRVITDSENSQKGNHHWPDMP